jgi:hypothetical protein
MKTTKVACSVFALALFALQGCVGKERFTASPSQLKLEQRAIALCGRASELDELCQALMAHRPSLSIERQTEWDSLQSRARMLRYQSVIPVLFRYDVWLARGPLTRQQYFEQIEASLPEFTEEAKSVRTELVRLLALEHSN